MSKFTPLEKKFLKEAFFAGWRRSNPIANPVGIEREFYVWLDHEAWKFLGRKDTSISPCKCKEVAEKAKLGA